MQLQNQTQFTVSPDNYAKGTNSLNNKLYNASYDLKYVVWNPKS